MPELLSLAVAFPTFIGAYIVFAMVGFGTTLVAAPIAAQVIPIPVLIPAQALMDLIAASANGVKFGAQASKPEILRLLVPMIAGSAFGAYILFAVPLKALMLLLGIFVVLYALNGLRSKKKPTRISGKWAWWYGLSGGMLSALFGAGAWIYSIYLVRRLEDPVSIRATQLVLVFVSALIRVTLFVVAGRYADWQLLALVATLLPAMVIGLYIGNRISLRMNRVQFMRVLYAILILTGSSLIIRASL